MTPRRIFAFLKRYLFKHPLYVIVYGIAYFLKDFSFDVHIYSKEEIASAVRNGKSIIRFGDGEINPLLGLRNHYHDFSPALPRMMKEIVNGYHADAPYILGMPKFIRFSNEELKRIGKFHVWLPIKTVFFLLFPKHVAYMDAHSFYYDGYVEEVIVPLIKDKHIVIVTKKETIDAHKRAGEPFFSSVSYVETPEGNILHEYDSIYSAIKREIKDPHAGVIVCALGPVGKHIIFRLAGEGYQSIDVGVALEVLYSKESLEWRI